VVGFENGSQLLKKRAVGVKTGGGVRKWLSAAKKRAVGVNMGSGGWSPIPIAVV